MAGTLITDLVDPQALAQLKELDDKMTALRQSYTQIAKEMVNGIKINVEVSGDLDKMNQVIGAQMQKASQATAQLNQTVQETQKVVANTTNTISRELAEQEKLNKAQREATTLSREALDISDKILGTREQNNIRLARLTRELEENKRAQDSLKKSYMAGMITEDQYAGKMATLMAAQRELKVAKNELNRVLENEQKTMNATEGSYTQLSLQLERMKMAYKQLNEEEKKGAEGSALEAEIQNLDAHLKDLSADMGEFQRNVGNYAIANKSVKKELKELTGQMAQMLADGVDPTSEEFLRLAERAGTLKDAMGDAKATISDYANDTKILTNVNSVLQTGLGAWQAYEGALSAFGIESKGAQEAMQKMQGIMSVMNGLQKISTELTTNGTGAYRAYHAILKLLGIERKANAATAAAEAVAEQANTVAVAENTAADTAQATATEAATVATGAQTAAVTAETAATTAATASTVALRVALAALGIGALIALVAGLVSVISDYNKEADEAADMADKLSDAQKSAKQTAAEAGGEMDYYRKAVENFNGTAQEEKALVDELNDKMGDAIGYYKSLNQWKKALITTSEYYLDVLKWEAEAQEYLKRYAEATADGNLDAANQWLDKFEVTKSLAAKQRHVVEKMIKNNGGSTTKPTTSKNSGNSNRGGGTSRSSSSGEDPEKVKQELEEKNREMIESANKMLNEWAERMARGAAELTKNVADGDKKVFEEQVAFVKQMYADIEETIDTASVAAQKEREKEYNDQIAKSKKAGIDTKKLEEAKTNELTVISEDYNKKKVANAKECEEVIAKMREDYLNLEIKQIATANNVRNEQYMKDIKQMEEEKQKAIENAEQAGDTTVMIEERYAKKREEIDLKYKQDTFQNQIDGLKKILESTEMTEEDRQKLAEELAKAEMGLQDLVTANLLKNLKKQEDDDKKSKDKLKQQAEEWLNFSSNALSAINDLSSAIFDGKIQQVEAEQEANQDAYDQQIEQIDELASTGAITEEEAEIRKREAKAATEAKEEELAKKKAKLQYKQALVEKANNISQIGIQTALAIMKASPNWVQVAMVSALGAMQLATAIAQPIKAYAEGTKGTPHAGGMALVGDGGQREVISAGGQFFLSPDTPTLIDLPKGAEVFPSVEAFNRSVSDIAMLNGRGASMTPVVVNNDYSELNRTMERSISENTRLLNSINKQIRQSAYMAKYEAYKRSRI